MPVITLKPSDFAQAKPLPEGWYKGELVSFENTKNKKGDGYNWVPEIRVSDGDGNTRPVKTWFSPKSFTYAMDLGKFYAACMDEKLNDEEELEIDTDRIVPGIELWVHLIQVVNDGNVLNNIDEFMPISVDMSVPQEA